MLKTYEDILATESPIFQLEVAELSKTLHENYINLQEFRKSRKLTQKQLAERLNISQVNISKVENSSDMMLSTLKAYVTAMGGELELQINFPDRKPIPLKLEGL